MNGSANRTPPLRPSWPERLARAVAYLAGWLLTGASAATSVMGAIKMVSQNKPLACALALGLNLMLFATAHPLEQTPPPPGYKYSRASRFQVWLIALCFSVWLSFVGFFDMYQAEVIVENSSRAIQIVLEDAAAKLNRLRSDALSYLNGQAAPLAAQLATESRRVEAAQRKGRSVSFQQLDRLRAQKQRLDGAVRQLNELKLLDAGTLGGAPDELQREIYEAFQRAATAHALLPEEFRRAHPLPEMKSLPEQSSGLQTVALGQLRKRDTTAWFLLFVALAIDLAPTLFVRSRTLMRRGPTIIREARLWMIELWQATFSKLMIKTIKVRLIVEGYPELAIEIAFGDEIKTVFVRDLQPHLEAVEREVSALAGTLMEIVAITSSSGSELIPDGLPLAAQLDMDQVVRLRLEPVRKEVRI